MSYPNDKKTANPDRQDTNTYKDAFKFLEETHKDHYKVYNWYHKDYCYFTFLNSLKNLHY